MRNMIKDKFGYQPQWYNYRYNEDGILFAVAKTNVCYDIYDMDDNLIKTVYTKQDVATFLGYKDSTMVRRYLCGETNTLRGYIVKQRNI